MNVNVQDLASSPSKADNFILPFDIDASLTKQDTGNLLKFIQSETTAVTDLVNTDSRFFPRAYTDVDLNDLDDFRTNNKDRCTDKPVIKPKVIKPSGIKVCVNNGYGKMDQNNSNFGATGYQPDVIMISSNQRPGPDGSPALVPSGSQGFLPSGNMSETGELFAPVRQLTFSDIDQSSHVEENYAQRRVSTPTEQTGHISVNNHVDQNEESGSSSEEHEMSPEFRQLDGEADSQTDLISTGAFDPTAMGINKEFLDNFTGRTSGGNMHLHFSNNVFSPLGSRDYGFRHENGVGQANRTITPPLHSPCRDSSFHNSPYRTSSRPDGHQSPRMATHQPTSDQQELQFSMSPTRNRPDFMPYQYNQPNIDILNNQYNNDLFTQYDFHRELEGSRNSAIPLQIRQSVSVGEERNHSEIVTSSQRQSQSSSRNSSHEDVVSVENDSNDNNNAARSEKRDVDSSNGEVTNQVEQGRDSQQYSSVPAAVFQQRYLQRTHVSVKLPQATYDSMAGDYTTQSTERYDSVGEQLEDNDGGEVNDLELENNQEDLNAAARDSEDLGTDGYKPGQLNNKSKLTGQSDPNQAKTHSEKFHIEMRRLAENASSSNQSEKSKDLNKNLDKANIKQVSRSGQGNNSSQHVVSMAKPQQQVSKSQAQATVVPANQATATFNPSSRLLQETVSQKNKTCQKFVSNVPSKSVNDQHTREFKKPYDVVKGTSVPTCSGARKTLLDNNTDKGAKLKIRSVPAVTSLQKSKQPTSEKAMVTNKNNSGLRGGKDQQSRVQEQSMNPANLNNSQESGEDHGRVGQIVTQVEKTSPIADRSHNVPGLKSLQIGDNSIDVNGMEDIRHQLQGMLRMSHDNMSAVGLFDIADRSQYEHSDILAGYPGEFGATQEFQRNPDISWNLLRKPQEEELVENFPSFSSQLMADSGNVSRSDASLYSENQRLRDYLEKERYRRKHCETYIQQLNVKLLETQQQVAVAVSTDKRKDIMIEQLDKQLARVVEGWKNRDAEKDEILEHARQEKDEVIDRMKKQEQMIGRFEHDMSEAVDALRQEKDRSAQKVEELTEKISEAERTKSHAEELLGAEQEKSSLLEQECDSLRETRENLDKKLDQMQRRLHREQDEWFQREQELLQRIEEVTEKNTKILQIERNKNEEQGKLAEEIMEQYQAANNKVKKLEMDLDAALREKESVKVEMGIMEAKFENAQRVLEADLQSTMEKQIADQISDVQKRMEKSEDVQREKHREQVLDLNERHKKELEKMQAQVREGLLKKEEEFRKQLQELENRLQEYREENANLKLSKQKLESQRLEILTKLQYMMQSQWNEALTLLSTNTPQRRRAPNKEVSQESASTVNDSVQSIPTVNFNLHSFCRPPASAPQDKVALYSPCQDSVVSHSTVKDEITEVKDEARDIEKTAAAHLKEFQDYINSITQTPEWISSLDTHEQMLPPRVQTPNLPTPPELAALLQSHLQNIQQQQLVPSAMSMPHPHLQEANQIYTSGRPLPNFKETNHVSQAYTHTSRGQSLSPPRSRLTNQTQVQRSNNHTTPPRPKPGKSFPAGVSYTDQGLPEPSVDANDKKSLQGFSPIYGEFGRGAAWDGSRAVPIRPPQQGEDPYQKEDDLNVHSSQMQGYFQGGQSFSPPTKQSNMASSGGHDDSIESIHSVNDHSTRLHEDYSQLSERVQQHESQQNDLQHYIQMLLNKSPSDCEHNDSVYSQDNTQELDLNDTAQAAQLQKELDRIQELRKKQEAAQKGREGIQVQPEKESTTHRHGATGESKILNSDQMAEITKMLNQVKGEGQSETEKLIEILKHMQASQGTGDQKRGHKHSPKSGHPRGDKHKGLVGVKRNVQFQPAKGLDVSRQSESSVKSSRPGSSKKMERKVAGSAINKGDKGSKPAAWK